MRRLPPWLVSPGSHTLTSGREVLVEPLEETWICVDLGGRLVAVVDLDEDAPLVDVSLQWPGGSPLTPPGTRPYGHEATVALVGGRLAISPLPSTHHQKTCDVCPVDTRSEFRIDVGDEDVESLLEVLAGLDRHPAHWAIPDEGVLLWRGLVDEHGTALVERLGPEERTWAERGVDVVTSIPLGLRLGSS